MREDNNNIDNKEKHYRVLLQMVEELSRFHLIRKMDTYKQLSHYFLYKHHDWREEFNKFLNSNILRSANPALKKVFIDFTETEFWWALLTDPQYNKNNRHTLLEDWWKWEINNGTGYTSERAKESLERLYSIYEKEKQAENEKKLQEEATQTIDRDTYLLNLFDKDEAIYDKFFERCEGKIKINIVIELTAATIAITNENKYLSHLLERGKDLVTLHNKLSKHFVLASYASFAKAITEYKFIPKERQYRINTAKEEYIKLLPQKLQDITTITTFVP